MEDNNSALDRYIRDTRVVSYTIKPGEKAQSQHPEMSFEEYKEMWLAKYEEERIAINKSNPVVFNKTWKIGGWTYRAFKREGLPWICDQDNYREGGSVSLESLRESVGSPELEAAISKYGDEEDSPFN